jgi:predicted DsbA family dithiol-disulfide isomerase
MGQPMKIDFVSDVSCPWCVIGLRGLEEALTRIGDVVDAEIHFQPFELNPNMPPEGQNIVEHIAQKYGSTPEQSDTTREMIRARAAAVGFTIATSDQSRIYNTFDAHRLLHWAEQGKRQAALKHALFEAYFTEGNSPADLEVLVAAAVKATVLFPPYDSIKTII